MKHIYRFLNNTMALWRIPIQHHPACRDESRRTNWCVGNWWWDYTTFHHESSVDAAGGGGGAQARRAAVARSDSVPLGKSWFYSTLTEVLKRSRPWLTPIHVPIWRPLSYPMQNCKLLLSRPSFAFRTKSATAQCCVFTKFRPRNIEK